MGRHTCPPEGHRDDVAGGARGDHTQTLYKWVVSFWFFRFISVRTVQMPISSCWIEGLVCYIITDGVVGL